MIEFHGFFGKPAGANCVAFAYRYGQCGTGQRRGTNFMADDSFNNECWRDLWNWTEKDL